MFKKLLIAIPFALSIAAMPVHGMSPFVPLFPAEYEPQQNELLASSELDLGSRYSNSYISNVFKDNILLNLSYLAGRVQNADQVYWANIRKPFSHEFVLKPGEVFAYHDNVLPEYAQETVRTTNSTFGAADGYRSSGNLYGDGVCHFASLINWAASDAGLKVVAPVNHDFAAIPGIDRKYGTAIYYDPALPEVNQQQNLYIKNTYDTPVRIVFDYAEDTLTVSVYK